MYVVFLALWIIMNGRITLEIILFGLVIAAIMYGFICKYMDYSVKKELRAVRKLPLILQYLYYLLKEIVIANVATMKLLLSTNYQIEPELIHFKTTLKTETAKVLLANSITLTPGTITVSVEDDCFTVHCLDKSLAEGIESSVFVKLLEKIEGRENAEK